MGRAKLRAPKGLRINGFYGSRLRFTRVLRLSSRLFLLFSIIISPFLIAAEASSTSSPPVGKNPNILFLLLDDFGFNDLGINSDSEGYTPNLNQFAREGVRFTRNYVDSTCSATRAGIFTGRYPASLGFKPAGRGISPEVVTLAEMLQQAGYVTHHVGKWHLGFASRSSWPMQQGFDSFYGFLDQFLLRGPHKADSLNFNRPTYINPLLQRDNGDLMRSRGHLSELLVKEFSDLLVRVKDQKSPWFINYWTYLPHTPLEPARRFATQYPDTPEGRYEAMLSQVDDVVGRVLQSLDEHGLTDSTLVFLVSDNGGTDKQLRNNAPFSGEKNTFTEGGLRTPLLIRWPGVLPKGLVIDELVSYLDYYPTIQGLVMPEKPSSLPGRNILPMLLGDGVQPQPLFWLSGPPIFSSWSVLNATGTERMGSIFGSTPEYLDLKQDSSGGTAAKAEIPSEKVTPLADLYRQWHTAQREVKGLRWDADKQGIGSLVGADFQRALGFNQFTLAISATPAAGQIEPGLRQVIASHDGHWSIAIEGNRLLADVLGVRVEGPAPAPGECSEVILTGYFNHAIAFGEQKADLRLYINGALVDSETGDTISLPLEGYERPTMLGQNQSGGEKFNGRLGKPTLLNEMLVEDGAASPWLDNAISSFESVGCDFIDVSIL